MPSSKYESNTQTQVPGLRACLPTAQDLVVGLMPALLRESHPDDSNLPLLVLNALVPSSLYLAKETSDRKTQCSWALDFSSDSWASPAGPARSYVFLNKLLNPSVKIKILIII